MSAPNCSRVSKRSEASDKEDFGSRPRMTLFGWVMKSSLRGPFYVSTKRDGSA
jgi:hypothetical protein